MLSYAFQSIKGTFAGLSQSEVAQHFSRYINMSTSFLGIPNEAILFFVICILISTYILSKGLVGIEKVAKIMMPIDTLRDFPGCSWTNIGY